MGFADPVERMEPLSPDDQLLFKPRTVDGGLFQEKIDNLSPWNGHISNENSTETLVVEFPYSQKSSALARCLGYSYVSGTKLKRVLPIAHPFWEFMRCRRVSPIMGVSPLGDGPQEPEDLGENFPRPYVTNYWKLRATLHFETPPFQFKTDASVTEEYERYTYVRTEPGYESLFVDGDTFRFDGGILADTTNGNINSFPAGRNIPLSVAQVLVTWYDVPLEFITKDDIYKNINFGIGKLNSEAIFGYPANTLLMDVPEIQLRPNPLPPFISEDLSFLANITFRFHYFEPTPLGTGVTVNLGHNMAIFRGDRKWYPCSLAVGHARVADKTTRIYRKWPYKYLFRKPDSTNLETLIVP